MAIDDVFRLVDVQAYLGQIVTNVYHYQNRREDGNANTLAEAFVADVLPFVTPLQSENLEHREIQVINLDNDADFAQLAISIDGNTIISSDDAPAFLACRLRLLRSSRAIRNGAKRYAGLKEGAFAGNSIGATQLAAMTDLADALTNPVTGTPTGEYDLVLWGDVTPNRPAPIVVDIDDVSPDPFVTTQNSRKPWVGT